MVLACLNVRVRSSCQLPLLSYITHSFLREAGHSLPYSKNLSCLKGANASANGLLTQSRGVGRQQAKRGTEAKSEVGRRDVILPPSGPAASEKQKQRGGGGRELRGGDARTEVGVG